MHAIGRETPVVAPMRFDAVEGRYPGFKAHVLGADGTRHGFLKVFVNGEPIASLADPVTESDEIEVLAAVGGG